jgi:dsDNA-specific endonuclease/ATPase MutS2
MFCFAKATLALSAIAGLMVEQRESFSTLALARWAYVALNADLRRVVVKDKYDEQFINRVGANNTLLAPFG